MAAQERSAQRLVALATSTQTAIDKVKADPKAALEEFSKQAMTELPPPDGPTNNKIWIIIVSAFAFVMVGSAIVLGIGVFIEVTDVTKRVAKSDTILTLFTTVVGFLAGLLAPSPAKK